MKIELEKPIIKYDKKKKDELMGKISQLEDANSSIVDKLDCEYQDFVDIYERAIVPNHDLFFTKRISNKLLLPLVKKNPRISRSMIEERVGEEQAAKQRYLECLSDLVVEIDNDKRTIGEDVFTLAELIDVIMLRGQGKRNTRKEAVSKSESTEYVTGCSKKLVKEIKRQYLLKNKLEIDSLNEFPADQEIPM